MEKLVEIAFKNGRKYVEAAGLAAEMSTVDKTKIVTGSKFWAVDEAKLYAYDAATNDWYLQIDFGGASA